ncbi:hypothetical protein D3C81_1756440 [compost metagenome]
MIDLHASGRFVSEPGPTDETDARSNECRGHIDQSDAGDQRAEANQAGNPCSDCDAVQTPTPSSYMELPLLPDDAAPLMPVAMIAAMMPSIRPVAFALSALRLFAGSETITALPAHHVITGLPS